MNDDNNLGWLQAALLIALIATVAFLVHRTGKMNELFEQNRAMRQEFTAIEGKVSSLEVRIRGLEESRLGFRQEFGRRLEWLEKRR